MPLRYSDPEDRIINRVFSDISGPLGESTLLRSHGERLTGRFRDSECGFPLYNGNNRDNMI